MDRLREKVALVTGGTKGLGQEICRAFVAEGAQVAVAARALADAERQAADLGPSAFGVGLDVTRQDQWQEAIAHVRERAGKLNVLVNCAGITEAASLEKTDEGNWRRHMSINLDGVFYGCQAALPLMRESGEPGSIVNISSMFALRPVPGFIAYCTSKAAMTTMTKTLALECAAKSYPIRANTVHPGGIETDMFEKALADTGLPRDEAYAHFVAIHPMKRIGRTTEVAAACVWLASEESSFTTGLELTVDGGGSIRA